LRAIDVQNTLAKTQIVERLQQIQQQNSPNAQQVYASALKDEVEVRKSQILDQAETEETKASVEQTREERRERAKKQNRRKQDQDDEATEAEPGNKDAEPHIIDIVI
jgi:hypothetical protein